MTLDVVVQTADASTHGILFSCIFVAVYAYALMFVYVRGVGHFVSFCLLRCYAFGRVSASSVEWLVL